PRAHRGPVAEENILRDVIVVAAGIAVLGIAPVRRLDRIGPQPDRRGVVVEAVSRNHIVLAVLDRDPGAVAAEVVRGDTGLEAVAAPHAIFAPPQAVAGDGVAAERRLDAVGGGVADVVAGEDVVVGAAAAGVHRGLTGPQEDAVAAVGEGVVGDDVAAALLIDQQSRRVLAARVHAVAVAADVVVDAIAEEGVVAV